VITPEVFVYLKDTFQHILEKWGCTLEDFGGEEDHVHLLVSIHPAINISELINNLKSASSKSTRNRFKEHVDQFFWKPYFWNRAYYIGSVGTVPLETVKNYIEKQNITEKKPKPLA
jgi:putative transposase